MAEGKSTAQYLEALDEAVTEKNDRLIHYLANQSLPKMEGKTKILDVGIGNGSGLEYIKNEIKDPNLVLYGLDILETLAREVYNSEKNVFAIVGDIGLLPFAERSMSAINFSSTLHEGISYNQEVRGGMIDIDTYIKQVFAALIRTLDSGGMLFYRDSELHDMANDEITFAYTDLVSDFVHRFHLNFRNIFLQVTHDTVVPQLIPLSDHALQVGASGHYHRELQRHLITYIDLATRQIYNISFKEFLREKHTGLIDENRYLNSIERVVRDEFIYDAWVKREGSEVYTYRSRQQLAQLLAELKEDIDFEIIESFDIERPEYSRFLQSISDTNLVDSKQCLVIRRK